MRTYLRAFCLLTFLATLLAWTPESFAQLKKFYDLGKVATIQGQIERLETITRQGRQAVNNRKTQIAHLKTDQDVLVVHLGPAEFLARQQFRPRVGEVLEVTGATVTTRQGQAFLAATVVSGGRTYQLRDGNGIPVWEGQTPGCLGRATRKPPSRS